MGSTTTATALLDKASKDCCVLISTPDIQYVQPKINFIISQLKHMLWVLKRTVSVRRFFREPKTNVSTDS